MKNIIVKCNCLTKTPDPEHHEPTCPVWLLAKVKRTQEKMGKAIDVWRNRAVASSSMAKTLQGERDDLCAEMAQIAVATGRSKADGYDTDWHDLAGDVKRMREALDNIARSPAGEDGCYHTNQSNIRIARNAIRED